MKDAEVKRLAAQTLAAAGEEVRCIAFAGVGGGEGCSSVVAALGVELARSAAGGVLVVDGALDAPELGRRFGVSSGPGLLDALAGADVAGDAVRATSHPGLSVLPCGRVDGDLRANVRGRRLRPLLSDLKARFQTVLVDAGAIGSLPESVVFAASADAAVLVLRAEGTRMRAARTTLEELRSVQPHVLGAVLNRKRFWLPDWLYRRL